MALLIALIMLVMMTMLALSAVRFSSLEVKMASNDELMVEAFQKATSVTDATVSNPANTPVTGNEGYALCTPNYPATTAKPCNASSLALPTDFVSTGDVSSGKIKARSVLVTAAKPPPAALGTSVKLLSAASFRIEGEYDRTSEGLGKDQINEGVMVLYPKGGN